MEPMLFSISPAFLWFIIGIICFLLELTLPGFFIFFFGISAWCVALITLVFHMSSSIAILIFLVLAIFAILFFRARLMNLISPTVPEQAIGCEVGEVIEDILPPACGKIKYSGTYWQAICSTPLSKGQMARVIDKDNITLVVAPVQPETTDSNTSSTGE